MTLAELFHRCAYDVHYETIGNDVNYAFEEKGDTLYIYFQGSSSTTDWIRNFLFKKRPYKDMKIPYRVHRGFLEAWKEVEDIIITKIQEKIVTEVSSPYADPEANFTPSIAPIVEYRWKKIVIIGYSHGASLTFFATESVWYHRPDLRETGIIAYAIESPRVFWGFKFPKHLQERWDALTVIRVGTDIVTHCPPKLFGFVHPENMITLNGNPSLVENKLPNCIKYHFPQVVYQALLDFESNK